MSKRFEKKFRVKDCFDKNKEYHLWILSFANARQDLFYVNKKLNEIVESNESNDGMLYFIKINIGHLNEAIKLIYKAFKTESSIMDELNKIKDLNNRYCELLEMIDGWGKESIYYKILFGARNNFFHYNNGSWSDREKRYDFDNTKEVLEIMYEENNYTGFIIGDKICENDFYFSEEIQLNYLFELGKKYNLSQEDLLSRIGEITSKVINILTLITDEFLLKVVNGNKGYKINYIK